jgi:predicted nucleotidyltransferase
MNLDFVIMRKGEEYLENKIYSIEELKVILAPAFDAYSVRRGYVFGSYSRGEADEESDIDIFVEPSEGFKSYEVCGILSRAMKLLGKGVDCYSSFDFDEMAPTYQTILKDRVMIYGKE